MDSVSLGDLYVAKYSNFNMKHIVFHGNNKSIGELNFAVDEKVGIIVVDNLYELSILDDILKEKNKKQDILIRINPGIDAHTPKYIQTAKLSSKFGESIYDTEIIDKLIKKVKSSENLNLLGFHAHIGSQIHETGAFTTEIDKMVAFQLDISAQYDLQLPTLNLGGGFGIKYTKDEKNIEIKDMMKVVSNHLDNVLKNQKIIKNIMIEPGRSIVGPAGITLYSCSQIKKTYGGKNYLFVDGGMTDNIRPALYEAVYECDVVNKMNNKKEILVDVVGKCCESGDIIRQNVEIPLIDNNDVLVVYATGAYNHSMSSNYNNHLKPAVISVGEKIELVARRETLEDLCKLF
jgi:diaminopimelate decarboxylase